MDRNPEQHFKFAPEHYREDWQHASRWSRLPYGYFCRGFTPTWRIVERIVFYTLLAGVAALFFWN